MRVNTCDSVYWNRFKTGILKCFGKLAAKICDGRQPVTPK